MERRRQHGVGNLQPLGPKKNRMMTQYGFGEDLGSTDYTERPKVARNLRAKSSKEEEKEDASSRAGSPIMDVDPDESGDPIDIISSQEAKISSSFNTKSTPQPAPFARSRSTQPTSKPGSTFSVVSKPRPTNHQNGKARRKLDSDEEDTVVQQSSQSISRPGGSKESSPPSEQDTEGVKPAARGPQPAPFKRRVQLEETVVGRNKTSIMAPKLPAPPPWKTGSTLQFGSKLNTMEGLSDHSDVSASQRVGESQIDRDSLKNMRIPKKNDKSPKAVPSVSIKESRTESKKASAFPMAGYAKQVAAKQVEENTGPRSPRKRFKPDDVERIFKQVEADELMGIDDETQPPLDPHNLCPFCDEPFPDNPSPDLIQLLTDLKKIAVSEPRLRNPSGLTAPLMTYINLCQMHRAESTHVEQGRRNHWPSTIDWDDVRERLKSSEIVKALRDIIDDPHSSNFFVTFYNNIKRDGALKAASIRAQLDTFELSHPGYYGEQGLLVLFDTLNELFPNLTSEECRPLTARQFFTSVLVPEAAALLIEQDMDCTHEEALVTLRESRQYGLAMFPDRGGFFGSGKGDHMDEAGAKQLKWRKDMVGSTYSGNHAEIAQSPMFKTRFPEEGTDPDVLIMD
ncbi:RTC4-like domain protein [Rhizoctonia solani AG-3 Rhs1AP]|uniref:Restriction of telomere capping protein 4 n=2 Tax=Rhizoctonia solani AG-3 TaxID=1086053 RepID=A0A074RWU3_9AGAM|nr:RTC4-like domain protein [Rhizoctonia solani AG-3 Rhs1AP]KEP51404.1 RTC4-like domain protein [Rhizoctonia solani 123E]